MVPSLFLVSTPLGWCHLLDERNFLGWAMGEQKRRQEPVSTACGGENADADRLRQEAERNVLSVQRQRCNFLA